MPHDKNEPTPSWTETEPTTAKDATTEETSKEQATESKPVKQRVRKYVVRCKYHTNDVIAYRVYAQSKEAAEEIARLNFKEEANRGRLLDAVKAVEVVNE